MISVYGICNPLLDFIAHGEVALVESMSTRTGTMNLIDRPQVESLLGRIRRYTNIPGGSGANTIRGIAWLNRGGELHPPVFCGAVGDDEFGWRYIGLMGALGVRPCMAQKTSPSGLSIIIVTPDRERTMFTYLGACREFTARDIDFDLLGESCILHVTGYMWDTENQKEAVRAAVEAARARRVLVSFDLADPFVVQRERAEFLSWIPGRVDLLFGNREELSLLCGEDTGAGDAGSEDAAGKGARDERIIRRAAELAQAVVMKVGREGCLVLAPKTAPAAAGRSLPAGARGGRELFRSPGFPVRAVDSTGAGDAFASGFLYAFLRGRGMAECARLGNRLAACIVSTEGCNYDELAREGLLDGG